MSLYGNANNCKDEKFQLLSPYPGLCNINIPGLVELLSAKEQRGNIVIYASVDANAINADVQIHAIETGKIVLSDEFEFLDTIMLEDGNYVLHIFWKRIA